jgi:hypothetical protein
MRATLLFIPVLIPWLAGCAHQRPAQSDRATFFSANLERSLQYWTANFSGYPTNHFYVYATDVDQGNLVGALVYWREGGRILDYSDEPKGAEHLAWRLRPKVDRNAVRSDERVSVSNDVVSHEVWVRWMKNCIADGKEYVVALKDARTAFPPPKGPS